MASRRSPRVLPSTNASRNQLGVETVAVGVAQVIVGIVHGVVDAEQEIGPSCSHGVRSFGKEALEVKS